MGCGWARAVLSVAESPMVRSSYLLQEILPSIGSKTEEGSLIESQRSLCTLALSPRELQSGGERILSEDKKSWCRRQ